MATIEKRGSGQYRVKMRRAGYPTQTVTFESYAEAEAWAVETEAKMSRGSSSTARLLLGSPSLRL